MILNLNQNPSTQNFKGRYPLEKVIDFVTPNNNIRKAEGINFINSIVTIKKDEYKAMLRPDNVAYEKQTLRAIQHLLNEIPELADFVVQIKTLPPLYKKNIIEKAERLYGKEIEIKKLINHKK